MNAQTAREITDRVRNTEDELSVAYRYALNKIEYSAKSGVSRCYIGVEADMDVINQFIAFLTERGFKCEIGDYNSIITVEW